MPALLRDFLPEDLKEVMRANGVEGAIAVQARQTLEETEWLLTLADANAEMLAVIGWAPLYEARIATILENFAGRPKLRGLRHVVQDEPDEQFILRDDFNRGVGMLEPLGLRYDILIYERQLRQTIAFVDKHPKQTFVLDHIAKPRIKDDSISPWKEQITELARRENVYCKVSGMATEGDWKSWSAESLRPYWDIVLSAFGPKRIMYGSDWPVLNLAGTYTRWITTVRSFVAELSVDEQERIWSKTAKEAYGI